MNILQVRDLMLKATHSAALCCYEYIGRGDKILLDQVATDAIRDVFKSYQIPAKIIGSEGAMDDAPTLNLNEQFGDFHKYDVVVDPVDCTTACSLGLDGAISIITIAEKNTIMSLPDVYMEKLISISIHEDGIIDLDFSIEQNIKNIAQHKNKKLSDVTFAILNRERHNKIITEARKLNCKIILLQDGDIMPIMNKDIDFYIGSGGAPEGVLSASIVKYYNGFMQGRLNNIKYSLNHLIKGNAICSITAITKNALLSGVTKNESDNYFTTESFLIDTYQSTMQKIITHEKTTG